MDSVLRSYAIDSPTYVQDTTYSLRKIQHVNILPGNTILATMDVESLYRHKDGLQDIKNTIFNNTEADLTNLAAKLCQFVLIHRCGANLFLQINGLAIARAL